MGGAEFATKNENKSLGFNLAWERHRRASASSSTITTRTADLGRRQSVRFERGARCRELQPRHDHGGLQP